MAKNLVIVESPAKSKTITKYLGKDFVVLASYGHVRDLVPREGAVDTDSDYQMMYEAIDKNRKHVDAIARVMKKADALYLATDPDREGEAISWHLCELLKERNLLKNKAVHRIVFHEITKGAVQKAVQEPRQLSQQLINAQQARRGMDYLVGFNLSPLLWKKIRRGLSAGRVQSPALRLITEREEEIEAFVSKEYWTIEADLNKDKQDFVAQLREFQAKPVKQFTITNEADATSAKSELVKNGGKALTVSNVEKKSRRRNPAPPFTTSTLQQEAVRKLGFSTKRTMRTAQQLYEGVDTGSGTIGLITYMRTDSVALAKDAIEEMRKFIAKKYGKASIPDKPRFYKTKAKNAQEAHEAIRPTAIVRTPDTLKSVLSADQLKLYSLIWKRTLACQMIHATMHTVAVDFACGDGNTFRATGSTIANAGFIAVYLEGKDDAAGGDANEKMLPAMEKGDQVKLKAIRAEQHFTEPPPRFTEATLVRALEEYGIGRPSTYASIISTLQNREYAKIDRKRFFPTDIGRVVNRFLTNHFPDYVDYDFTAHMEDDLDAVSRGEKKWIPVMDRFWRPFIKLVKEKEKSVSRADATTEPLDEQCPKCQKPLMLRLGSRGQFIGCSAYPDCDYTRNIDGQEEEKPEIIADRSCPSCGASLLIRTGKYGKFIGCSAYPDCKHIEPLEKPASTGTQCPKCQQGEMLTRKSRRGKIFYSCSRYPDCDYAVWDAPVNQPCPSCAWPMLTLKTTKRKGETLTCPQKECSYSEPA